MKKLIFMDLSYNKLKVVTEDWSKFKNLRVLDISKNPLSETSTEQPAAKIESMIKKMASSLKHLEYFSMAKIPLIKQTIIVKWILTHFKKLNYYSWTKITKSDRATKTINHLPDYLLDDNEDDEMKTEL